MLVHLLSTRRARPDAHDLKSEYGPVTTFRRIFNILVESGYIPEKDRDNWSKYLWRHWQTIASAAAYKVRVYPKRFDETRTQPLVEEAILTIQRVWDRFYSGELMGRERNPGMNGKRPVYISGRKHLDTLGV